ncbi:hypothetical protein [Streptomyces hesseae]|uniref:Amidohydrolase n=1 Tax=Streptomyces hesseae TaxID=3075519 RepID=A0ABU2SH39_9ACTN|nr:hypothetical protein [Streptomyces sp. DSM 40473]MDT0448301.1 hypothetical protein [Streptomyces sp. DSM 40473]
MTKIDVHHHFLPDFYRSALRNGQAIKLPLSPWTIGRQPHGTPGSPS